jgi:hypothetical protein
MYLPVTPTRLTSFQIFNELTYNLLVYKLKHGVNPIKEDNNHTAGDITLLPRRPHQALGFIQLLTEMSTRNIKIIMFLGSKVQRVCRADNLTAISELIV